MADGNGGPPALNYSKQRGERDQITSLYERGCALLSTGDLKAHDHELTLICIELESIDPACEELRMLMEQAMTATSMSRIAEVERLTKERKFAEAEGVLKVLYMHPDPSPDYVAQVDSLAAWLRKQARNSAEPKRITSEPHVVGAASSGMARKLTAKLRSLFKLLAGI